jgi:hypothetical protein
MRSRKLEAHGAARSVRARLQSCRK